MGKNIVRIVITGGPCAGKSTAMVHIREYFVNKGYTVLLMSETATELINSGISPWSLDSKEDYQRCQLAMQRAKEEVFLSAALRIKDSENVIIVCDRGMIDSKAYMGENAFNDAISILGMSEENILLGYDAVFCLASAANGAEEFYTVENNTARMETVEEAALLDVKFSQVWGKHRYFKKIQCCNSMEEKINNLISEIEFFLDKKCHM